MFKNISINLTGPICSCEEQSLSWGVQVDERNNAGVQVGCKTCGTKLIVPNSKFTATFALDKAYPGKPDKPPKSKTKLDVMEGGKVLSLAKPDSDEKGSDSK